MKTLFKVVSVAAGVSMAAVVGVASSAQAQQAQQVTIQTGDLNLNSSAGAARFDARVNAAAGRMCADSYQQLSQHEACVAAVRDEANANLSRQLQGLPPVAPAPTGPY